MTFDDEITAALRRDLQAAHVGFDAGGAEDMIRVATQSDPLGERRAYAAPLAAAAAVVVIGGGVATFAATRGGDTATGGGPIGPAVCGSTAVAPTEPPSAPRSTLGSAMPPVYTTPETPPTTVRATPDSTAPGLPLPSRTSLPSTSPVTPVGPPVSLPATGSIRLTLPPTTAAPAVPSASPTDDSCAPSGTSSATASDLPAPLPTSPGPLSPASACSPRDIDPGFSGCIVFDVKATAPGSGSASFPIPDVTGIPSSSHFTVLTYEVENPSGNAGTVTIEQDNTIFARHRFLAASTSPVLSVDSPVDIATGHPALVRLSCESTTRCDVRVSVAARIVQAGFSPTETTTPTPTHT